jgi:chromosome partitioning protein
MSMKSVAVVSPKGGNGKTAVSDNLVRKSVESNERTLAVDFDKQGSLSKAHPRTADPSKRYITLLDLFGTLDDLEGAELEYLKPGLAIIRVEPKDFDALLKLEGMSDEMAKRPARILREFADQFDVGVYDTPGSINQFLKAAMTAASAVVCPLKIGLYDTDALAQLWKFMALIRTRGFNPKLRLLGMIPSLVDTRDKLELDALQKLREHPQFGPTIWPFMLAHRVPVSRAINMRRAVWEGAKSKSHKDAAEHWTGACERVLASLEG